MKALDAGDKELAKKFMDAIETIDETTPTSTNHVRYEHPTVQTQQIQPPPPVEQKSGGSGSGAAIAIFFIIIIIIGFVLISNPRISPTGSQVAEKVEEIVYNPPSVRKVALDTETHLDGLNVYATSTLTLRNDGGSGYVTIEYYSDASGLLLRREYYIRSGATETFVERLDISVNDKQLRVRIAEQRAG